MEQIDRERHYKVCANCGEPKYYDYYFGDLTEDEYCRYCGKKLEFIINTIDLWSVPCVYGPVPTNVIHTCEKCGYSWKSDDWSYEKYCPKCGGNAPITHRDPYNHVEMKRLKEEAEKTEEKPVSEKPTYNIDIIEIGQK